MTFSRKVPLACIASFCNGTGLTHVTECRLDLNPYPVLIKWFGQFPTCTKLCMAALISRRGTCLMFCFELRSI